MRFRLRLLGTDVFDLATGRDAVDQPDTEEASPGVTSADLGISTWRLSSGAFPVDDQPLVYPEDRSRP